MAKFNWMIIISSEGCTDTYVVRGSREEVKQYLLDRMQADKENDEEAYDYGADDVTDIEEDDKCLTASVCYSDYHTDYCARLITTPVAIGTPELHTATGQLNDGKIVINLAEMIGILMEIAVYECSRYRGDLFSSWQEVEKFLQEQHMDAVDKTFIFAFRDCGVDGETYYHLRKADKACYGEHPYSSVWTLTLKSDNNNIVRAELKQTE